MGDGTAQAVKSPPREPAGAAEKYFAGRTRPGLPCAAKLFFDTQSRPMTTIMGRLFIGGIWGFSAQIRPFRQPVRRLNPR